MDDTKAVPSKRYWENSDFWKDAGERVVSSFVFGTVSLITIDVLTGPSVDLGIKKAFMVGGISSVLSTIKAIIGSQRKDSTTPVGLI